MNARMNPETEVTADESRLHSIAVNFGIQHRDVADTERPELPLCSHSLCAFIIGSILTLTLPCFAAEPSAPLPKTQPLVWEEADLSARLMDGAHQ